VITRRDFIRYATAGATGVLCARRDAASAEPAAETRRLRIAQVSENCYAPQYLAEDLLRAEGFSELQYVRAPTGGVYSGIAKNEVDLSMAFSSGFLLQADAGAPIVMLAGMHPGCLELVASERIRSVRDLKGRTVGVPALQGAHHAFVVSIIGHVGLDPRRDINWAVVKQDDLIAQLNAGKVDATMLSAPQTYQWRAKKVGHVILNMTTDRPWSQYFCCVLAGNREFVRKNPVATKRALRAILKGASLCAHAEPAARQLVKRGFHQDYDATVQMLRDLPYARWADYDVEDAVRFYALRLREGGMLKSSPQKILAEATDFRFLNELKKELKA
jgi:NitT/TauT family transport system substrate-binding protein